MRSVLSIKNWDYTNPHFLEIKYEDLIQDFDLTLFYKIFSFMKFPESLIPHLLEISRNNSMFSSNLKKTNHIRSGKTNQWKKYFKEKHKNRFIELFGDVLIKLGYEKDNNW